MSCSTDIYESFGLSALIAAHCMYVHSYHFFVFGVLLGATNFTNIFQDNFPGPGAFVQLLQCKRILKDMGKHITCLSKNWSYNYENKA